MDGQAKAYTLKALGREGAIDDTVGGHSIRVTYNTATESVMFENLTTQESIAGVYGYWFAWDAEYPETEVLE